jgi:hypothetical protein
VTDQDEPFDAAIALIASAQQQLQAAKKNTRTEWRWLIRIDVFDALGDRLVKAGALITDVEAPEPTFLGMPYDLGWPPAERPLMLNLTVVTLAPEKASE